MPNELDLMQLVESGQKLATIDNVDYVAVHVVFALPADGTPEPVCLYADWSRSWPARLAAALRDNAELAELAATNASEVVKLASRVRELERQLAERPAETGHSDTAPESLTCADCGKNGWKSAKALQMHQQRAHRGMRNKPLAATPVPTMLVIEAPWHCADCDSTSAGPFTRSLSDPARCIRCAQLVNGHLVAA